MTGALPSRRIPLRFALILSLLPTLVTAAEIQWTGKGGDSLYRNPANWSGGTVPGPGDTVLIQRRTALRASNRILDYYDGAAFGTLIVDVPRFAMRCEKMDGTGSLHAHGNIVFQSGHSISNLRAFGANVEGNATMILEVDPVRVVNNSAGVVSFSNSSVKRWGVQSAVEGSFLLSGPGDFNWYGGLLHESVRRFGSDAGFSGTLTIFDEDRGGTVLRPSEGLEVRGGTVVFAADEVLDDGAALRIGGTGAVVDFSGRTETLGELIALKGGGTLRVDAYSLLTFSGIRLEDVLNIEGFVEGRTRIAFPESTEGIENLRINGKPAYWAKTE